MPGPSPRKKLLLKAFHGKKSVSGEKTSAYDYLVKILAVLQTGKILKNNSVLIFRKHCLDCGDGHGTEVPTQPEGPA